MRIAAAMATLVVVWTLAGCASTTLNNREALSSTNSTTSEVRTTTETRAPASTETTATRGGAAPAGNADLPFNLTPLSIFNEQWAAASQEGSAYSDAYTRVLVNGQILGGKGDGKDVKYAYEPRNWLQRLVVGKEFSMNLTARVNSGSYAATLPLVTVGHQSNSDGEQWQRVVYHTARSGPLFLVKRDGTGALPRISVELRGTNTYTSRGAAAALSAAVEVAKTVSAAPPVITRLTADSAKTTANAIDTAISKVFSSGITEQHITDADLRRVAVSQTSNIGAIVRMQLPEDETDWNSQARQVAVWTITFDRPRPSIFSDIQICPDIQNPEASGLRCARTPAAAQLQVRKEVDPAEVLNYKLTGQPEIGTVRAFLTQQEWYTAAMPALAGTDANGVRRTASDFCRRVLNEITALDLNGFDAQIVLWAVAERMPYPVSTAVLAGAPGCEAIAAVQGQRR